MKVSFNNWLRTAGLAAVAAVALSQSASAAFIAGSSFGATGTGVITFQVGGVNFIDWCPANPGSPTYSGCPTGGTGTGTLTANTGSGNFTDIPAGTAATILDVTDQNPPQAPYSYLPVGIGVSLPNFILIPGLYAFDAQVLQQQTCTAVPGEQLCIAAFRLTESDDLATGQRTTSVTLNVTGIARDLNEPGALPAAFSTVITGQYIGTIQQVLTAAQTPTGAFSNTFSSTTTVGAPIPEPGTYAMLLSGGLLVGISALRRRRKA
jgi:hypothetical protein